MEELQSLHHEDADTGVSRTGAVEDRENASNMRKIYTTSIFEGLYEAIENVRVGPFLASSHSRRGAQE